MVGQSLKQQGMTDEIVPEHFSVKEAVFPFNKFPGVDPQLGPEMKSTGEVMGVGNNFGEAFGKSQLAASVTLPRSGKAFLSVRNRDKKAIVNIAKQLSEFGFDLIATGGTAATINEAGIACEQINKVTEGRPHIVDSITNGEIDLIVNTTEGRQAIADSATIRSKALQYKVTYTTTIAGGEALCQALLQEDLTEVHRLQDLH
jgi:carbamoyl-phosphate synthase large subunit